MSQSSTNSSQQQQQEHPHAHLASQHQQQQRYYSPPPNQMSHISTPLSIPTTPTHVQNNQHQQQFMQNSTSSSSHVPGSGSGNHVLRSPTSPSSVSQPSFLLSPNGGLMTPSTLAMSMDVEANCFNNNIHANKESELPRGKEEKEELEFGDELEEESQPLNMNHSATHEPNPQLENREVIEGGEELIGQGTSQMHVLEQDSEQYSVSSVLPLRTIENESQHSSGMLRTYFPIFLI
jgi:hypothetical protein